MGICSNDSNVYIFISMIRPGSLLVSFVQIVSRCAVHLFVC